MFWMREVPLFTSLMRRSAFWFGALCVCFGVGCITEAPKPPPTQRRPDVRPPDRREPIRRRVPTPPPPPPPDAAHLAPQKVSPLQLSHEKWALPKALTNDKTLRVVVIGNDVWVGGVSGLFRIQNGKFEEISKKTVVAMAPWVDSDKKTDLVISHGKTLEVYDRGLVDSSLNGKLGNAPIVALYSRGTQELWLGTSEALWQLKGDKLSQFSEVKGVKHIRGSNQAPDIIVTTVDGRTIILREETPGSDSWSMRALSDDGTQTFNDVSPASAGEFWGITGDMLYLRRRDQAKGEAAWWPFVVQPDAKPEKPGDVPVLEATWKIKQLMLNPLDGFTWGLTSTRLLRLDGGEVKELPLPKELEEVIASSIVSDGALWLTDGTQLVRIGQEQRPPSYKEDIAPFMQQSCLKCHNDSGVAAHFLVTDFEKVKAGVDAMIKRIEIGSMPPPPQTLRGGDALLLKRWKETGFQP